MRNVFWLFGKILALLYVFVGGGFLAIFISVFSLMMGRDRQLSARRAVRAAFRFYVKILQLVGMFDLRVENPEALGQLEGKIIVANHISLLDVVFLISLVPEAQCIIKSSLWRHVFLRYLMRSAGYIRNDLPGEELLASCKEELACGRNLIIFPQGTRQQQDETLRFHRGFANLAIYTDAPIQLVYLTCMPPVLFKGEPLFHAPARRPVFNIRIGEQLDNHSSMGYPSRAIAARRIASQIKTIFEENLYGYE